MVAGGGALRPSLRLAGVAAAAGGRAGGGMTATQRRREHEFPIAIGGERKGGQNASIGKELTPALVEMHTEKRFGCWVLRTGEYERPPQHHRIAALHWGLVARAQLFYQWHRYSPHRSCMPMEL